MPNSAPDVLRVEYSRDASVAAKDGMIAMTTKLDERVKATFLDLPFMLLGRVSAAKVRAAVLQPQQGVCLSEPNRYRAGDL